MICIRKLVFRAQTGSSQNLRYVYSTDQEGHGTDEPESNWVKGVVFYGICLATNPPADSTESGMNYL